MRTKTREPPVEPEDPVEERRAWWKSGFGGGGGGGWSDSCELEVDGGEGVVGKSREGWTLDVGRGLSPLVSSGLGGGLGSDVRLERPGTHLPTC